MENYFEIIFSQIHECDEIENKIDVTMAEWLRRWTRNPMGFPRAGSNPAHDEFFHFYMLRFKFHTTNKLKSQILMDEV